MAIESKKRRSKIMRQKLKLRNNLWPKLDDTQLWDRQNTDGWLSIPRAAPLLNQIMDSLSKGKPISSTYFELWCRTFDDSFVIANKHREMAFYSGFNGERAERTWMSRMRILHDLGFIVIAEGPSGPISYVLVLNPYKVIKRHYEDGKIGEGFFNALIQRVGEIKANDLEESKPQPTSKSHSKPRRKLKLKPKK